MTKRIPVIHKGKPCMPMKIHRAYRYVQEGKAKWRFHNKLKIRYIVLLVEPSNNETQLIHLGIDPGSHFDGFSIVSEKYHHDNFELIHNKGVKKRMDTRRMYRRVRRTRLRHRPIRFNNRTADKLIPTIRSMFEFRKWIISYILDLYPVAKVIIEDVAYNHANNKNGKYFSQAEQGKTVLYNFITSKDLELEIYHGYKTKQLRIELFGSDIKIKNKGSKVFEAHCIDSFALATIGFVDYNINQLNNRMKFIEKIWYVRKELYKFKRLYSTRCKPKQDEYFRFKKVAYQKQTIKKYFIKLGRTNISRVKETDNHSNHPYKWIYMDYGRVECFKHFKSKYGGTCKNGISKYMNIFNSIILNFKRQK